MRNVIALIVGLLAVGGLAGKAVNGIRQAENRSEQIVSSNFHLLWTRSLDTIADSAPAYLPRVRSRDGHVHAVVYVLAGNNSANCDPADPVRQATLYAFDAGSGRNLWRRSTRGPARCTTAGPVVDKSTGYVYAAGLDGKIHRYRAGTGKETRRHGWPRTVTLMPDIEKISATPTIAHHHLYVTTSGFIGDQGHYQGHLVTIDLAGGKVRIFNTLCSNIHRLLTRSPRSKNYCPATQSGLFGRGQGVTDQATGDVYIVSGNGPWNGRTEWGDSVLTLDSTGATLLGTYTPTNQKELADADADLGSSGPALLPDVKHAGRTYHFLVQAGKGPACSTCNGAALRLLDRDHLSGKQGHGRLGGDLFDTSTPNGDEVLTAPAIWRSPTGDAWDFVANGSALAGYRVVWVAGALRLQRMWMDTPGGTTPVLRHGVLYLATSGQLRAISPLSGAVLSKGAGTGDVHWQYPLVVHHKLFMADQRGRLTAYQAP
ncbi:MAG: hypothetical protein NVS2B16_08860 [Chloroflexota bacterium]